MKTLLATLLTLTLAGPAFAAHHENDAPKDAYPLSTCVVSGEKLGGMGEPYVLHHQVKDQPDREVRLCCEMCVGRFNSNPERFLAKLDAAKAKQDAKDTPRPSTKPDHAKHTN
ncbi:hypothetical protein [Synoicihabitans lomoniglobus]|uniref:Uncharacterized protein n=1 Tax=Synoicihabitans lomoniglobus TaxID=2909285 RepID=A0AAF0CPB3_9BACT|nr:hypothetical protein [Opitutaceae bacterium LMO-M01]WED63844.1 hypothetical protein PXH66_16015 [Opitutaceae bacterium LMO-M01]